MEHRAVSRVVAASQSDAGRAFRQGISLYYQRRARRCALFCRRIGDFVVAFQLFNRRLNKPLSKGEQNAGIESGAFMIDDKIKIKCTKCSQVFRERAQKLRNGFQMNCQHCNRLITFDSTSEDRNIRRALMSAKEVRVALEDKAARERQAENSLSNLSRI